MKSAAIRSVRAKPKPPFIAAKIVSPDEFRTLWGEHQKSFHGYQASLKDARAEKDRKKRLVLARVAHIRSLRSEGLTYQEIGDSLGVTRERVRQLLMFEPTAPKLRKIRAKRVPRKDERLYALWRGIL